MLMLNNVSKKFQSSPVLEDISLTFENGVYGLLSPNGAGKTTLLKLITTLLFPTSGEILWNGQAIKELGADYRGILGYLPQSFGYYGNYSPTRFLKYIAALQKMNKREAEKKIDELLELVALSEVKNKKMKRFSGGMIQRVGIAQAMLNNPKLLILDEPTTGLDPKERVRFRNLIHRLAQDRIVILSTHIVSDVETIAKQIIMIKNRHLYCCETPSQITQSVQGKIFEVPAGYALTPEQLLLSERESHEGHLLRIASPVAPKEGVEVRPNLEDAFLYIYRDEVGAVAANHSI
ncbi:ATP-binding cassette domain-containing protein [Gracilibacillus sp. S3-1-1]|uniref:ATP-binding cassette domain-containing protein n=1 Tax=Gracilibacillus pellucidus TaxID=3095368 RepID=A0ACC6M708_9BACI|nr:ATP-binding cassette domain-containing protein [Gracilibacillus sp. S3-1-1]MDX8046770.1 ATP-binding cassette domain-containing protein [Gracilibacillus sp. S3-1-1]